MNLFFAVFMAAVFVALTPGILLRIPMKASKYTVAVVHGLAFLLAYYVGKMVLGDTLEGFAPLNITNVKFVKIANGSEILQLSQVAVIDSAGVNIAKGRPTASSGVYGGKDSKARPEIAVDGTMAIRPYPNGYHSSAGNGWWQVTLDKPSTVNSVVVYNRADCCKARLASGYQVLMYDKNMKLLFKSRGLSAADVQEVSAADYDRDAGSYRKDLAAGSAALRNAERYGVGSGSGSTNAGSEQAIASWQAALDAAKLVATDADLVVSDSWGTPNQAEAAAARTAAYARLTAVRNVHNWHRYVKNTRYGRDLYLKYMNLYDVKCGLPPGTEKGSGTCSVFNPDRYRLSYNQMNFVNHKNALDKLLKNPPPYPAV